MFAVDEGHMMMSEEESSCTSSLATTASEFEDLFLGVEAHSFERKKKSSKFSEHIRMVRNTASKVHIVRRQRNSDKCSSQQMQVSALRSIQDVIAAREFDACSLLRGLGFGYSNTNEERNQILKRFKGSEKLIKKSSNPSAEQQQQQQQQQQQRQIIDTGNNKKQQRQQLQQQQGGGGGAEGRTSSSTFTTGDLASSSYDVKGIYKTRDWLNHITIDHNQATMPPADQTSAADVNSGKQPTTSSSSSNNPTLRKSPGGSLGSPSSGLHRIAKMRSRFSKSRQSSFEIMPGLEEEEAAAPHVLPPSTPECATEAAAGGNITETTAHLHTSINQLPPRPTQSSHTEKLHLDRDDNDALNESSSTATNDQPPPQLKPHHSAIRSLTSHQKESFELEEINSNEDAGDLSSSSRVVTTPTLLTTTTSSTTCGAQEEEDQLDKHRQHHRDHHHMRTAASDDDESSSGFDEDEVQLTTKHQRVANSVMTFDEIVQVARCPHSQEDVSSHHHRHHEEQHTFENTNNNNQVHHRHHTVPSDRAFKSNFVVLHSDRLSQLNRRKLAVVRLGTTAATSSPDADNQQQQQHSKTSDAASRSSGNTTGVNIRDHVSNRRRRSGSSSSENNKNDQHHDSPDGDDDEDDTNENVTPRVGTKTPPPTTC